MVRDDQPDAREGRRGELADAVGKTPYQNVSYFPGTFEALAATVKTR